MPGGSYVKDHRNIIGVTIRSASSKQSMYDFPLSLSVSRLQKLIGSCTDVSFLLAVYGECFSGYLKHRD